MHVSEAKGEAAGIIWKTMFKKCVALHFNNFHQLFTHNLHAKDDKGLIVLKIYQFSTSCSNKQSRLIKHLFIL